MKQTSKRISIRNRMIAGVIAGMLLLSPATSYGEEMIIEETTEKSAQPEYESE